MNKFISKLSVRYCVPLTFAALGVIVIVTAVAGGWSVKLENRINATAENARNVKFAEVIDAVHEQRVRFAADHGVVNPAALVTAVRHSPMASLLISVAIEESLGDPVAVGSAGEQGAWQVKSCCWGLVPKDIHGQAGQAERIIRGLLIHSKGNKIKALARYNGGTTPPGKSYRYAKRVLKRARHLQVAENYFPPNGNNLRDTWLVTLTVS